MTAQEVKALTRTVREADAGTQYVVTRYLWRRTSWTKCLQLVVRLMHCKKLQWAQVDLSFLTASDPNGQDWTELMLLSKGPGEGHGSKFWSSG